MNEELNKVEKYLDEYESKIGLGNLQESDVSRFLQLNEESLRKLSPEECGEGAYLLNKEALFVQHELNKYKAQLDWAKTKIDRIIAGDLNQYGGRFATFETRQILAIKSNDVATNLQKIVDKSSRIIARLSYIPNQLKHMADVLLSYKFTKMSMIKGDKNEAPTNS